MIEFTKRNIKLYNLLLNFINLKSNDGIFIARNSIIGVNTFINSGTRINGKIVIKGQGKCIINKYCAIGDNVRIITTNHNMNLMNLQYALQTRLGLKNCFDNKSDVIIGHNVWIGDSAIILAGVSIGNGAIVGAGALVTKSIPAYAVAGGVPARVIKYRFNAVKIQKIEELQWWNWSFNKMKDNLNYFKEV